MALNNNPRVGVLVGGVGGAKLAYGLMRVIPPEDLTIIVNVADDFWHYGLRICPDIDTILYTLSGRVDPVNGWGLAADTTTTLDTLRVVYGEGIWFRLGDKDIATHLLRTDRLRAGQTLTKVTAHLATQMGIACRVLPVTDQEIATMIQTTDHGTLGFQDYFVRHRWQPTVHAIQVDGVSDSTVTQGVRDAIAAADVVLLGPSNPWLSITPILDIPEMREMLLDRSVPRVAITPIIEGRAVKGPAAKIMRELGYSVASRTVAEYYGEVINGFVNDQRDEPFQIDHLRVTSLDTLMNDDDDKVRLARQVLEWIQNGGFL